MTLIAELEDITEKIEAEHKYSQTEEYGKLSEDDKSLRLNRFNAMLRYHDTISAILKKLVGA